VVIQFKAILSSVDVSKAELKQVSQILEKVKAQIALEYPDCQVDLFRYDLRSKNPFCGDILIFCQDGPPQPTSAHGGIRALHLNNVVRLVEQEPSFLTFFEEDDPKYKQSRQFQLISSSSESEGQCQGSSSWVSSPLTPYSNFWLVSSLVYLVEVQLSRLLDYMMTFDHKCSLLNSLLHYFCTVNSCYFGGDTSTTSRSKVEAMQWLLIFFMSREKLIPTVREVMSQPHPTIIIVHGTARGFIDVDIGFGTEEEYRFNWKWEKGTLEEEINDMNDKFVGKVMSLFKRFLMFLGQIDPEGALVLNTRDSEILNRVRLDKLCSKEWGSKLPKVERRMVKNSNVHIRAQLDKWPFTLVHPLIADWNLGYCPEEFRRARKFMRRGVLQMNGWERARKAGGSLDEMDLESVLKIN